MTFNIDEYVGLPRLDPNSQHSYMWDNFFRVVDAKRENVHFLDGNASDLAAECVRFEAAIEACGGIDLAFFSTGRAGHVARNEPGSSLKSRTRPKTLDDDTLEQLTLRWQRQQQQAEQPQQAPGGDGGNGSSSSSSGSNNGSNGGGNGGGGGAATAVPKVTLTMGVGTLLGAKEVVVLFSGTARARALEAALEMGVNHMFPVSAFQRHQKCLFLCDEDATIELRVKTVKYFKGLATTATELSSVEGGAEQLQAGGGGGGGTSPSKRQKKA